MPFRKKNKIGLLKSNSAFIGLNSISQNLGNPIRSSHAGKHVRCYRPDEAEEWSSLIAAEFLHHFNRDLGQASR